MDFKGYERPVIPGSDNWWNWEASGNVFAPQPYLGGNGAGSWGGWTNVNNGAMPTRFQHQTWDGFYLIFKPRDQRVTVPRGFGVELALGDSTGTNKYTFWDQYKDQSEYMNSASNPVYYIPLQVAPALGYTHLWARGREQTDSNGNQFNLSIRPIFNSLSTGTNQALASSWEWLYSWTGTKALQHNVGQNQSWSAWAEIGESKGEAIYCEFHLGNDENNQTWGSDTYMEIGIGISTDVTPIARRQCGGSSASNGQQSLIEPQPCHIPRGSKVFLRSTVTGTTPQKDVNVRLWYA